jgi:hypothetical protein
MVERSGSDDPRQGCAAPNFCTHKFGLALMQISRPIRSTSGVEFRQLRPGKFPLRPLDELSVAVENLHRSAALVDV